MQSFELMHPFFHSVLSSSDRGSSHDAPRLQSSCINTFAVIMTGAEKPKRSYKEQIVDNTVLFVTLPFCLVLVLNPKASVHVPMHAKYTLTQI